MAKFEVLYLDNVKVIRPRSTGRSAVVSRPFKKLSERGALGSFQETIEVSAGAYGHENIKVGDVLEINGPQTEKARKNPMFREVTEAA